LTKADIGTPSNFKHVTHVGWNAKSGFDLSGEDEALRPFLQKAGVSESQLKDRRTRDFIYDFIQTNNVEAIVKNETKKPNAPPVPTRHQNQNGEKPTHRLAPPVSCSHRNAQSQRLNCVCVFVYFSRHHQIVITIIQLIIIIMM
jgi:hypothetical protein